MATSAQMADEYLRLGREGLRTSSLDLCVANLDMARSLYLELGDHMHYIQALHGLCTAYGILGYNSKFIASVANGIAYCDDYKLKGVKHLFYSDICNKYLMLRDYDNALNYAQMALHDIELFGITVPNAEQNVLIAHLNISYPALLVGKIKLCAEHLAIAKELAEKNDIHYHDFTIKALEASLAHKQGDDTLMNENMNEFISIVKSTGITIEDFTQDIELLISTFNSMSRFDSSDQLIRAMELAADGSHNDKLMREACEMRMRLAKRTKDEDAYVQACIKYAESDIAFHDAGIAEQLVDLDTSIALSIASSIDF